MGIFLALNMYLNRNSRSLVITVICGFNSHLGVTGEITHLSTLVFLRSTSHTKPDPLPEVLDDVTLE